MWVWKQEVESEITQYFCWILFSLNISKHYNKATELLTICLDSKRGRAHFIFLMQEVDDLLLVVGVGTKVTLNVFHFHTVFGGLEKIDVRDSNQWYKRGFHWNNYLFQFKVPHLYFLLK